MNKSFNTEKTFQGSTCTNITIDSASTLQG